MKTINELISEKPIGTVFNTEESLPEASDFTKIMLGKSFRCVRQIQVIECEDGSTMTLKNYIPGFESDPVDDIEDDEESEDEEDDWEI